MAANSLLASAIQMLCVIAWRDERVNAELLAKSLDTNPVVVRRVLKALEGHGIVELHPGRHGGVELARAPADITLEDVYKAVEPDGALFALRERANPRCQVSRTMQRTLPALFGAADAAVSETLRQTRLSTLMEEIG